MIEPKYYPLSEAASMLNCTPKRLIHFGVQEKIGIHVLTGHGILLKEIFEPGTGRVIKQQIDSSGAHPIRLSTWCLADYEAGICETEVILLVNLERNKEDGLWALKVLNTRTGHPLLMKEAELVVMSYDIKRIQQLEQNPTSEGRLKSIKNTNPGASNNDWKPQARQIGIIIHQEKPHLSLDQIADRTNKEMIERKNQGEPDMCGRGGKVPSAQTIKRHALTGIKT